MRRVLLLILAISVIGSVYAQSKRAYKDLRQEKRRGVSNYVDIQDLPVVPFKPRNLMNKSVSAMTSKAIGTSANVYSILLSEQNYLDVNQQLNAVMFTHRQGGAWGGTSSGDLRCKVSGNFGTSWDSVAFVHVGANLYRYPSGVLYNPTGNTSISKAVAAVVGPATGGSGWVANYMCSKMFDGTNVNDQINPVSADTSCLTRFGLTQSNGYFHVATPITDAAVGQEWLYHWIDNGVWNSGANKIDWTRSYIKPNVQKRTFGDGAGGTVDINWDFSQNIAFDANGTHGYFYHFANYMDNDSNIYSTTTPCVWETFDAGATWTKRATYNNWHTIADIKNQIYPTAASYSAAYAAQDPSLFVYRPDFPAGAAGDEGYYPGVVDAYGNLHIACVIQGMYSDNPDSLGYSYANHPLLLFDVYQYSDTGWGAIFVDTLYTDQVDADVSGYGTGTDAVGWDHKIHMATSPDRKKVFITWTDTDPTIDTTNIMPEPKSWGFDVTTSKRTNPTSFATGMGNCFFFSTARTTLMDNGTYKVPATYIDIYESNQNPASAVKHYYLSGIEFVEADFMYDITTPYPVPQNNGYTVSGTFNYNNTAATALSGVTVNLMNGTSQVASATTDASGAYSFANVNDGNYNVTASTSKPWGGVTAVDVLKIKRHVAGLELLTEPIRLSAADPNNSATVTATDALKVQRRIAGLDASFTKADWLFEIPVSGGTAVAVAGANVTKNFYGLCTGDVNGSNIPTMLYRMRTVALESNNTLKVNTNEVFEVPVNIAEAAEIGALQLSLSYPANIVEVVGVTVPSSQEELMYTAKSGKLNIVWSSLNSMNVNANDAVVKIQLKAKNAGLVSFNMLNENEIADAAGFVFNANLNVADVEVQRTLSTADLTGSKWNLNNYPNPFSKQTRIEYEIAEAGKVSLKVYDILGKEVASLVNTNQAAGKYSVSFNSNTLSMGMYSYKLDVTSDTQHYTITKQMSVIK